ncbi:MAG: type II secretion system protein [bacterium]
MNNKKGFTLIELLVVIAIIGLLSTLAVVALNSARMKARDARRVGDVKQIQTALELYYNDNSGYPAGSALALGVGATGCLDQDGFDTAGACSGTVYMGQVPSYPAPRTDGDCTTGIAGYTYNSPGAVSTYYLKYCLGGITGGVEAGLNTACESGISGCAY